MGSGFDWNDLVEMEALPPPTCQVGKYSRHRWEPYPALLIIGTQSGFGDGFSYSCPLCSFTLGRWAPYSWWDGTSWHEATNLVFIAAFIAQFDQVYPRLPHGPHLSVEDSVAVLSGDDGPWQLNKLDNRWFVRTFRPDLRADGYFTEWPGSVPCWYERVLDVPAAPRPEPTGP